MRAYLAGPRSGIPKFNSPAFSGAAMDLREQGLEIISPVELDDPDDGMLDGDGEALSDEVYARGLEKCLTALVGGQVEAVIVLPGWEDSHGATLEVHIARSLGKRVLRYPDLSRVGGESPSLRTFATGATRDTDDSKPDYEGYLSPAVLRSFGRYMQKHSQLPDGTRRPSDNWQRGIPQSEYMKSAWRHFMDWWELHRGGAPESGADLEEAIGAVLFNALGYLHEALKDADAPA